MKLTKRQLIEKLQASPLSDDAAVSIEVILDKGQLVVTYLVLAQDGPEEEPVPARVRVRI